MDLGAMVRTARKAMGMTQAEAAERAGVSARALWTVENGGGHMETLRLVAAAVEFRIAGLPVGKSLGGRILAARTKRKWTRETLARKAGISIPTVSAIENDTGQVAGLAKVLAVISPDVRVRKSEKANWTSGGRDKRYTPGWLLDEIIVAFGPISLDPCAGEGSEVVAYRYIFEEEDGLLSKWTGKLAYVNPPFSAAAKWLDRCYTAWADGECQTVVCLVPVRTNSKVWMTRCAGVADILFLPGRPNFRDPTKSEDVSGQTPFGVMLIIWGGVPTSVRELSARLGARLMERDRVAA